MKQGFSEETDLVCDYVTWLCDGIGTSCHLQSVNVII